MSSRDPLPSYPEYASSVSNILLGKELIGQFIMSFSFPTSQLLFCFCLFNVREKSALFYLILLLIITAADCYTGVTNPCKNGGTCSCGQLCRYLDAIARTCDCANTGYTGYFCEIGKFV